MISKRGTARADARRSLTSLLQAAKAAFAEAGTGVPVRDIARRAGVGIGTVYRHFPTRADLVAAVFAHEIEQCAQLAERLSAEHPPIEALTLWMHGFVELALTKRGLADALHSGDAAFDIVPAQRRQRLYPAFARLFDAALTAGVIGRSVGPDAFLNAAAVLCASAGERTDVALDLVLLLLGGLRNAAPPLQKRADTQPARDGLQEPIVPQ